MFRTIVAEVNGFKARAEEPGFLLVDLIHQLPAAVAVLRRDMTFIDVNAATADLLGYAP